MGRASTPKRTAWAWLAGVVAALTSAATARAGPPSAFTSYVAPHLVTCPAGDSSFVVIARDPVNNPWWRSCVGLHMCSCTGLRLSAAGSHPYTVDPSGCVAYRDPEYPTGYDLFPLAAGGLCPGDSILVEGDGVFLRYVTRVASFDQT